MGKGQPVWMEKLTPSTCFRAGGGDHPETLPAIRWRLHAVLWASRVRSLQRVFFLAAEELDRTETISNMQTAHSASGEEARNI